MSHEQGRRGIHIGYWGTKPERKRPLGRPICKWVHNINMDLREIGLGSMDWNNLA
jgi:hypothetical protein